MTEEKFDKYNSYDWPIWLKVLWFFLTFGNLFGGLFVIAVVTRNEAQMQLDFGSTILEFAVIFQMLVNNITIYAVTNELGMVNSK